MRWFAVEVNKVYLKHGPQHVWVELVRSTSPVTAASSHGGAGNFCQYAIASIQYYDSLVVGKTVGEITYTRSVTILQDPSLRRRKRVEDLIRETEIDESSIEIDKDIVIGAGGSSTVFLANYDGVNAACKVYLDA